MAGPQGDGGLLRLLDKCGNWLKAGFLWGKGGAGCGEAGERRCCWCWLWGCWKWGCGGGGAGWCCDRAAAAAGPIWGEKFPPKLGLTWCEKFWNSSGPLLAEAGLKKLTSSLMMVDGAGGMAADQLLKLESDVEAELDWTGPDVSW